MSQAQKAQRELAACQKMCEELRERISTLRQRTPLTILTQTANDPETNDYQPGQRRMCTGHFGKIYALHWGVDSKYIVTASQDGKLIIWSSMTGNKQLAITLNSAWVMTCAFANSYDYIASGGLDNTVTVFRTTPRDSTTAEGKFKSKEMYQELEKHDGYLSCARFLHDDDTRLISASGDGTCILWDVETHTPTSTFIDHTGDVMSVALNPSEKDLFVSGSVDATAKVWDIRQTKSIANFPGHDADINTVQWFPDNFCIVTGSDDGTVRIFDKRSYRQLNSYINAENRSLHCQEPAGVTSVDVSRSGQYLFSAYDNGHVFMWATLRGDDICDLPHDSRVSSLGISPDGYALATGCWDFNLRIFA